MWPFSRRKQPEEARDNGFTAFRDLVTPVAAGVSVTEESAVNLPAVYKCVALNAETISSLPLDVYVKRGERREPYRSIPPWFAAPNEFQSMAEFVAMTQVSLDLDGNCYWLKAVDGAGRVAGLLVLPPSSVEPKAETIGGRTQVVYYVTLNGGREAMSSREVTHLRTMTMPGELKGLSPIMCAKQTIGIGIAAEQFGAQFFGSGAHLSGVIETGASLTQEQTERLQQAFTKRHGGVSKSHALGVLSGGAHWVPMSVKPEEAQFLESRRYTATEIANLFSCPPEFVTDTAGSKGYVTALHTRMRMWYLTGLLPRATRIEKALSECLPRPAYVKFNFNGLLRMDPAERTAFFAAAQLGQWMTRNEIRALEDMNPLPGGDEMLKSVQWQQEMPDEEPGEEPDDDEVSA